MVDLPKKTNALVARAPGQCKIEEVDTPRAGKDDIVVEIEACGICSGDAKAYHDAERFWGGPNQSACVKPPFIPGREFIGHVVETGSNVKELDLLGAHLSPYCFPSVIEWIAEGKLPTKNVASHACKLDQWQEAYELAASGADATRVVIVPH